MKQTLSDQNKAVDQLREQYVGKRVGPYIAWNSVSRTQVWQWCQAMGDNNPEYLGNDAAIAPPTMLQSWTFRDVNGHYAPGSTEQNTYAVLGELDQLGFFGSVAVSYDQHYHRYPKEGDRIHSFSTITDMTELKQTGLGTGCFVTETAEYFDQDDQLIGTALITYLKYAPQQPVSADPPAVTKIERIRPIENHDSSHYWQGLREGKLLLQRCTHCETLRHPPQPMCEQCQSLEWETLASSLVGEIYSYTSLHHPHIPPFESPNCIVLVDLDEGARIAAHLRGTAYDQIQIGARVVAQIEEVQDGLYLPIFEVTEDAG